MRTIYILIFIFFPIFCACQDEYVIIGELRFGKNYNKAVFFDEDDGVYFRIIDTNRSLSDIIVKTELAKKERYYDKKNIGTEIRIRLDKKAMDSKNSILVIGELFTYLNHKGKRERILGRFRHRKRLSLDENQSEKIGPYTFKLKNAIEIWDPAKFSIASTTKQFNKLLFTQDSLSLFYQDDVEKILSYHIDKNKNINPEFLISCYSIFELIKPYFNTDSYISNEKKELDEHIQSLHTKIDTYKNAKLAGTKPLDSLERDLFESEIVEEAYNNLLLRLSPLYKKLNEILFEQNPQTSNCNESKIDFNFAVAYSPNGSFNRFELNNFNMIDSTRLNENSFSLMAMTNLYAYNSSQVNIGLGLGIGIHFQEIEIHPAVYLGTVLAFGKEKHWAINFGFSYTAIERLNPAYQSNLPFEPPLGISEDDIIGIDYRWNPTVSIKIPFSWVWQSLSGIDKSGGSEY